MIRSIVIRAGGMAWSNAALYHPHIILHASHGKGGGVSVKKSLHILSRCRHPPSPVLFQRHPNGLYQPYKSPLVQLWFLPCGDSLVNKYPHLRQCSQVVVRHLFVWLQNDTPQFSKDLVCPRPHLKAGLS